MPYELKCYSTPASGIKYLVIDESTWTLDYTSPITGNFTLSNLLGEGPYTILAIISETGEAQGYGGVNAVEY